MTEKKRKELAKKALLNQQVNAIKAKENSEYKSIIGKSGDIEWVRKDSNAIEYEPQNIGLSVKYVPKGTDADRFYLINGGISKNKEETSNTDIAPIAAQFALSNGVNLQKEPDKTTKYTPAYNIIAERKAQQKTLNEDNLPKRFFDFKNDYQNAIAQVEKYFDKKYSTDGDYFLKKFNDLKFETAELKKLFESKKDDYIKPYGLSEYNNILKSLNFYADSINEISSAVSKNVEYNLYFPNEEEYRLYEKYGVNRTYYDKKIEEIDNQISEHEKTTDTTGVEKAMDWMANIIGANDSVIDKELYDLKAKKAELEQQRRDFEINNIYELNYKKETKNPDFSKYVEQGKKADKIFSQAMESKRLSDIYDKSGKESDRQKAADYNLKHYNYNKFSSNSYQYLTDEEKDIYYYYLGKYGEDKANKFLEEEMENTLGSRLNEKVREEYENASVGSKIALNVVTPFTQIAGSIQSGASDIKNMVTGEDIKPYDKAHTATNFTNMVRGQTEQDIQDYFENETVGKIFSNAYSGVMTAADSVIGGYGLGGTGYSIVMGLSAADSYATSAYEKGADPWQIAIGATLTGAAECFFEKFSIEQLLKPKNIKGFKDLFISGLKQGGIEVQEELATQIADYFIDDIVMGAKSDKSTAIRAYMNDGMSESDARQQASKDRVEEMFWIAYSSFISGDLGGSLSGTANYVQTRAELKNENLSEAKQYIANGKAEDIIALADKIGLDTSKVTKAIDNLKQLGNDIENNNAAEADYIEQADNAAKELVDLGKQYNNKTKIDKSRTDIRVFEDFITGKRTDAKLQSDNIITEYNEQAMQMSQDNLIKGLNEATKGFGFEVVNPGHKSEQSILNKIERKTRTGNNDYNFSSLKDHTRAAVIMNDLQDVPKTIDALKQKFPGLTGEVFLTEPLNNSGYRGIHLTAGMENGLNSEIQLTTKEAWEIKKYTDAIYDKWRNVDMSTATIEQFAEHKSDYAESARLWEEYYSGFAPEVIRIASDSVIGLESAQSSNVRPLLGFPQESPVNSKITPDSDSANNTVLSNKEYSNSISSTPSKNIIPNNESKVNDSKGFPVDKSKTDIRVFEEFINGKRTDNNQQNIKSDIYSPAEAREIAAGAVDSMKSFGQDADIAENAKYFENEDSAQGYSETADENIFGVDENENPLQNEDSGSIIETYRGKGIEVAFDSDILPKTIKQVKKATKKVTSNFKILETYSEPIIFGDVKNGLAENSYDPKTGLNTITLRKADFANPDLLLKSLNNDYISGVSYETDNIQSLVAHEMGHNAHIALALKRSNLPYGRPLTAEQYGIFENEYNKICQEIYVAAFSDETGAEIQSKCIKDLGKMTKGDPHELIAQSFGNYYYGKNKSEIAKKIVEYFKKGLK